MHASIIISLGCVLVVGCASEPPPPSTPKQDAGLAALAGMLLIASAVQDTNPSAAKTLEVRIPASALELINAIEDYRRKFGKWPTKGEITAPSGVNEIGLTEVAAGLEVMIKAKDTTSLRCTMENDGTVVFVPPFFQAVSRTNQMQ